MAVPGRACDAVNFGNIGLYFKIYKRVNKKHDKYGSIIDGGGDF